MAGPTITPGLRELHERSKPDSDGDAELCGAELTSGGTCERLESECPYDSHRE